MFLKKNRNFLTRAMLVGALCNIAQLIISTVFRAVSSSDPSLTPDMLDVRIWSGEIVMSLIQIVITAVAFRLAWVGLMDYKSKLHPENFTEVAKLKEDAAENNITRLSIYSTGQLVQLWSAVMVGGGVFHTITNLVYRNFVQEVINLLNLVRNTTVVDFVELYNRSHGFKYIGMLMALLLGIYITGVFLQDSLLKRVAIGFTIFFALAFTAMEMVTITVFTRSIGIVWSSVVFHLLQTVGLLLIAAYLSWRYKGL